MKTIGFFGDSFCATIKNDHSVFNRYETYIEKLSKNYDAKIVNTGHGGSSVWDCILLQYQSFIKKNKLPDICVFTWTEPSRLFHRDYRYLNHMSIENSNLKKTNTKIYNASLNYFHHLFDLEKHNLEYTSLLYYFDKEVISKEKNTKFIHLWCFNESVRHRWSTGVEVRPSLYPNLTRDIPSNDPAANHLGSEEKNKLVYNVIKDAIDNYEDGRLIKFL